MSLPLPEFPWPAIRPSDSTADAPSVLDLDALRNRCLGNEQLVYQILLKLESALASGLEVLDKAWDRRDLQAVATAAHRLKGTAANVAAERLRQSAEALEIIAIRGQTDETEVRIRRLGDEKRQLAETLGQYLATLNRELKSE